MDEIALHVLDIIQNSVRAGARCIQVRFERQGHMLRITISDDGCGMSEETAAKACSPFSTSRTTRKVGLGLPLLMASAQGCGGSFGGLGILGGLAVAAAVVINKKKRDN